MGWGGVERDGMGWGRGMGWGEVERGWGREGWGEVERDGVG